jgi:hypothetical protein
MENNLDGGDKLKEKFFTGLSAFCLVLAFLLFNYDSTTWYGKFFDFLYDISIFTPLIIGVLGIISAFLGVKGAIRIILILLNLFSLMVFLFVILMALFGFQEP